MSELHRISPQNGPETQADLIFVHDLGGGPVLTRRQDEEELRES